MEANNVQKMRDALEKIVIAAKVYTEAPDDQYPAVVSGLAATVCKKARDALVAPARNCDVYKTPEDCMREFESYVREHGKLGFINPYTEVVKWLLAPAAELKGEGDGR